MFGSMQLSFTPGVQAALQRGRPVVALESTIISHGGRQAEVALAMRGSAVCQRRCRQITAEANTCACGLVPSCLSVRSLCAGMPYPQNLETAQRVEATVRQHGATPATIAILSGQIHIGLTPAQLTTLARAGTSCMKVSRRDIAVAQARRANGATTVAATMLLAHAAGIRVFVTGGVGGVHRGAEATLDVSADLTELGRTPIAVVCAGVKSVRSCFLHSVSVLVRDHNRGGTVAARRILNWRRLNRYASKLGMLFVQKCCSARWRCDCGVVDDGNSGGGMPRGHWQAVQPCSDG